MIFQNGILATIKSVFLMESDKLFIGLQLDISPGIIEKCATIISLSWSKMKMASTLAKGN